MIFVPALRTLTTPPHRNVLLALFATACITNAALLKSTYLFFDDTVRTYSYRMLDEGVHGRFLTDLLIKFFYDGLHTDASPFTQISALAGFALGATFLFYGLAGRLPRRPADVLMLTPFVVSPYIFNLLVYRFDSLWFGLAAVFACLPFVLNFRRRVQYVALASFCLWTSLCLYQPLQNLYPTTVCAIAAFEIASRRRLDISGFFVHYVSPYLLSLVLYVPVYLIARKTMQSSASIALEQTRGYTQGHSRLPDARNLLTSVWHNLESYVRTLYTDWRHGPLLTVFCLLALLFVGCLAWRFARAQRLRHARPTTWAGRTALLLTVLGILCIAPYGPQLALTHPTWDPRTFVSIGALVISMLVLTARMVTGMALLRCALLLLAAYLCVWSAIFLSTAGNNLTLQNDFSRHYKNLLIEDMNVLRTQHGIREITSNTGIGQTPPAHPFSVKYPTFGRSMDGVMDQLGWLYYAGLRYAALHYIFPFPADLDMKAVMQPGNMLIERSGYSIYRISPTSTYVDFHPLIGWENKDQWVQSYEAIPGKAAH